MLTELIEIIQQGRALTEEQVVDAVSELTRDTISAETKAEFLTALACKGETIEEITAFAQAMQAMSISPPIDSETRKQGILDVCGTGGDRLNTFNISTTVALVMAAAGVNVAKHGNRAITSKSGSADVLEALGIKIDLTPEAAATSLRNHNFAFFFAPHYHPAYKSLASARKLCAERGQRTIFNFLGPLLNPARPTAQLMGVPRRELCAPIASVLQGLSLQSALVVCGSVGEGRYLDELSTIGENTAVGFPEIFQSMSLTGISLQPATLDDLAGGDCQANARIIQGILDGTDCGPKRDAVLLNCAAAMWISQLTDSLIHGWAAAAHVIDSGRAQRKLEELRYRARRHSVAG